MPAGDQGKSCVQVGAQFVRGAGLSRVVAGDGQSAAQLGPEVLEASHVVALPAV